MTLPCGAPSTSMPALHLESSWQNSAAAAPPKEWPNTPTRIMSSRPVNLPDASGKFTGRLDMMRVGVFGHSFGGAAAALFCHEDSRCKAGIDVDGAPHGSVIQAGIEDRKSVV